jgi:hypothetical protein
MLFDYEPGTIGGGENGKYSVDGLGNTHCREVVLGYNEDGSPVHGDHDDAAIPELTDAEKLEISAANEESAEEYDFTTSAEEIAKARGQVVVWPGLNWLQIDIDSAAQWRKFEDRFNQLGWDYEWTYVHKSRSGPNRFHVYIVHPKMTFTDEHRLLLQAMLEDDPKRCWLNYLRFNEGVPSPSRLFEQPGFDYKTGIPVDEVEITPEAASSI